MQFKNKAYSTAVVAMYNDNVFLLPNLYALKYNIEISEFKYYLLKLCYFSKIRVPLPSTLIYYRYYLYIVPTICTRYYSIRNHEKLFI